MVKENQVFQKEVISRADAMKMAESGELGALGPRSEPSRFKIDLLNDIPEDEEISSTETGILRTCAPVLTWAARATARHSKS